MSPAWFFAGLLILFSIALARACYPRDKWVVTLGLVAAGWAAMAFILFVWAPHAATLARIFFPT